MANTITTNLTEFNGLYGADNVPIAFAGNSVSTTIVNGLKATLCERIFTLYRRNY